MIAKLANMECELYKSNEQYPSLEMVGRSLADPRNSICVFLQLEKRRSNPNCNVGDSEPRKSYKQQNIINTLR